MENQFVPIRSLRFLTLLVLLCSFAFALQAQNTVYTYAGTGTAGYVDGDTSIARFNNPRGIAVDDSGNVFVVDGMNHVIRRIGTDGMVSTFAGTGQAGYIDGPAAFARFNSPYNLCIDPVGNIFVSDFLNQRIRKITPAGMVSTVAGTGVAGYLDGPDSVAQFNYPRGICIDDAGNLYVGDSWNHRIRKINPNGDVSTYAGGGNVIGVQSIGDLIDGPDTTARFYTPTEVSIDTNNNLYVADAFNHRIRKVDASRVVSTIAGSGVSGAGGGGFQNGPGAQALFDVPTACHVTQSGDIFIGDGSSHRVRKIDTLNNVSTFAGSGMQGFQDGPVSTATFNFPRGIVKDYSTGRLFIVDLNNNSIRFIQDGPLTGIAAPVINQLKVYPNPVQDVIVLELEEGFGATDLVVYNGFGQTVVAEEGIENHHRLNLSGLPGGIYHLEVRREGVVVGLKRVVKAGK